jgi:hypothetical protein
LLARRNIAAVRAAFFILVLVLWGGTRQIVRREQSIEAQFAVGGSLNPAVASASIRSTPPWHSLDSQTAHCFWPMLRDARR